MRDEKVRGIAARAVDSDTAWFGAEVFIASPADDALAATHPGIDQPHIADADALCVGADCDDFADILMAHGERQLDAAIEQFQLLAAADVVIAVPDVQVGMA